MRTLIITKKYFKDDLPAQAGKSAIGFTIIELVVVMAIFLFIIGGAIGIFLSVIEQQRRVLAEQELLSQISYTEEYMSKGLRMASVEPKDGSEPCLIDTSLGPNAPDHQGYIYLLTRYDSSLGIFRGIKFLNQSSNDSSGLPACQEFFLDNVVPDGSNPLVLNDSGNPLVLKELKTYSPYTAVSDDKAVPLTSTDLLFNNKNPIRLSINGSNGSTSSSICNGQDCGASSADTVQPRVTIVLNIETSGEGQKPTERTIQTTVSQRNLNVKKP